MLRVGGYYFTDDSVDAGMLLVVTFSTCIFGSMGSVVGLLIGGLFVTYTPLPLVIRRHRHQSLTYSKHQQIQGFSSIFLKASLDL